MEHGLINEGASCYFNVIVQLLYSIPAIHKYILGSSSPSPELQEWRNLFRNHIPNVPRPLGRCNRLLTHLGLPYNYMMDVSEVLMTKVFPLLEAQKEFFELCYVKEHVCTVCENSTFVNESYYLFPINETDKSLTEYVLSKLSSHYEELPCAYCEFSASTVPGTGVSIEASTVPGTGASTGRLIRYHDITLPQYLLLYDTTSTMASGKKNMDILMYDDTMDILVNSLSDPLPRQYELRAIIYHHGLSASRGHYTIAIRNRNKIIHYDDMEMKEIASFRTVTTYASGKTKIRIRPILFYYSAPAPASFTQEDAEVWNSRIERLNHFIESTLPMMIQKYKDVHAYYKNTIVKDGLTVPLEWISNKK